MLGWGLLAVSTLGSWARAIRHNSFKRGLRGSALFKFGGRSYRRLRGLN